MFLKIKNYDDYEEYLNKNILVLSDTSIGFLLLWYVQRVEFLINHYPSNDKKNCNHKLLEKNINTKEMLSFSWHLLDTNYVDYSIINSYKEKMNTNFEFLTGADFYGCAKFDILVAIESFLDYWVLKTINKHEIYFNFYLDNIEKIYDQISGVDLLNDVDFQMSEIQNEVNISVNTIEYIKKNKVSSKHKMLFWG